MNLYSIILYISFLILGICVCFWGFECFRMNFATERDNRYIRNFKQFFEETKDLTSSLKMMQMLYDVKSKEYKAVTNALDYLEHSIYGDYETAVKMIEDKLYNKKINALHKLLIQLSIKKLSTLSLENKSTEE